MRRGDPISTALHLLAHISAASGVPLTSEHLATCLHTNPVVVRRALAVLRRAALVRSTRGHGGGWTLARPASEITVREVYAALGARVMPAPHAESPGCWLEASVNNALAGAYEDVERILAARLERITLADLHHDAFREAACRSTAHEDCRP